MLKSELEDIQYLDLDSLRLRLKHVEDRARVEQCNADAARENIGQTHVGPANWKTIAESHQRMADVATGNALIYREAIAALGGP